MGFTGRSSPVRPGLFWKIEDGCDSYCSYCKIPFARGVRYGAFLPPWSSRNSAVFSASGSKKWY